MNSLNERQQLGRAKNAASEYLAAKLSVPKIYLDAIWNGVDVDLLAIDRAGVGDVHAVSLLRREENRRAGAGGESFLTVEKVSHLIPQVHSLAAQYRYIAVVNSLSYPLQLAFTPAMKAQTFAEDGVGRIGILYIDLKEDEPVVEEMIKPERFRSSKQILRLADEYVAGHTANMEYRDPADYQVHS